MVEESLRVTTEQKHEQIPLVCLREADGGRATKHVSMQTGGIEYICGNNSLPGKREVQSNSPGTSFGLMWYCFPGFKFILRA